MNHLLIRFEGCKIPFTIIEITMRKAALALDAIPLQFIMHAFPGNGITALLIISESHLALHTWPEKKLILIDIFSCNNKDPKKAIGLFKDTFKPKTVKSTVIVR